MNSIYYGDALSPNIKTVENNIDFGIQEINRDPFWISRDFDLRKKSPVHWRIKRLIDITASTIGIMLILPVLLIVALSIKLESQGPVIFKQKRKGLNGKEFNMYKFRSMSQDAEKQLDDLKKFNESNDITMFKLTNDPRITKVGKVIRKFSLDELPQLFNIIKGEMSLVGPRPLPNSTQDYNKWHYIRFATLPGITGMWQVNGRSEIKDFDTVVKLDSKYISNWNVLLDFSLLLKTIPIVLFCKGSV